MGESVVIENNNTSRPKIFLLKKHNMKIGLLLVMLLLIVGTFYGGFVIGKTSVKSSVSIPNPQISQKPQTKLPSEKITVTQTPYTSSFDEMIRIYPSLSRRYSFYIYPVERGDTSCFYGIRNSDGIGYDISKVLGSSTIICSEGQGKLMSSFVGWAGGDKFLIDEGHGEIKIIDVGKYEAENYKYDTTKYQFLGANRSLDYWLFRKIDINNISYVLLNKDKNVVLDNIDFESNDRGALYDEVNDGFLFISRTFTGQNVSVKFDFLSMSTLSLRNILTTEPTEAPGRGCSSEYLISQPGEIILTQGCLTVDNKYLGSDGNIHIKL